MRFLLAIPLLLLALPAQAATFDCLNTLSGPLQTFDGEQPLENYDFFSLPEGARFDARGATFRGETWKVGTAISYPVDIRSAENTVCWAGGAIVFDNPEDLTWQESYSRDEALAYDANHAAIIGYNTNLIIDGVRVHNSHDAFRPFWTREAGTNVYWQIRNSWVSWNRDDCIENDLKSGGMVEDNLFDGCFVFYSSRSSYTNVTGDVTMRNNLVHLQEMPGPREGDIQGHGELFKTDGASPGIVLENNVFLIDDYTALKWDENGTAESSFETLGFKNLVGCSNNIIIWRGPGDFPGNIPNDPSCVTVTTDMTVWEEARADWLSRHPEVMRLASDPVSVSQAQIEELTNRLADIEIWLDQNAAATEALRLQHEADIQALKNEIAEICKRVFNPNHCR